MVGSRGPDDDDADRPIIHQERRRHDRGEGPAGPRRAAQDHGGLLTQRLPDRIVIRTEGAELVRGGPAPARESGQPLLALVPDVEPDIIRAEERGGTTDRHLGERDGVQHASRGHGQLGEGLEHMLLHVRTCREVGRGRANRDVLLLAAVRHGCSPHTMPVAMS